MSHFSIWRFYFIFDLKIPFFNFLFFFSTVGWCHYKIFILICKDQSDHFVLCIFFNTLKSCWRRSQKKILTNNKYCRGSPKNNPKRPVKDCRFFGKHTLCQNHLVNAAFQQSQEYHSRSWDYSIIVPSIVRSECNPAQRCLNLTHSLTSVKKKKKKNHMLTKKKDSLFLLFVDAGED